MATEKTLQDAFNETLKDVFYAEKQSVRALKKATKAAQGSELKTILERHADESATQVDRLIQVFELIGKPARAKTCEAMQGLVAEMEEDLEDYEIARYGLLRTWARKLGLKKVEQLLAQTLEEEKKADALLSQVAGDVETGRSSSATVNPKAKAA
jgi:ferritin-like metal-binding protein YciE